MKENTKKDGKKGTSFARLSKGAFVALVCISAVLVILAGALAGAFFAMKTMGRRFMENRRDEANTAHTADVYDSDVINYGGKKYKMNKDLTTLLVIGVDTGKYQLDYYEAVKEVCKEKAERTGRPYEQVYKEFWERKSPNVMEIGDHPGQADALFLLVLDEKNRHVSIISIDRNSMSYYETFDSDGNNMGTCEGQLSLSYSYGDGAHESCKITADAVSDFLYEIPVHAYCSIKYAAIKELNDAVGGVKVTVPVDMTAVDERLTKGSEIVLDGDLAKKYVSARQNVGDGSNRGRLDRQKEYILSFIESAANAVKSDIRVVAELYDRIYENICTDMSLNEIIYVADIGTKVDFSFHSIEGTTDENGIFAEFRADESALWQLMLDIFYICEE